MHFKLQDLSLVIILFILITHLFLNWYYLREKDAVNIGAFIKGIDIFQDTIKFLFPMGSYQRWYGFSRCFGLSQSPLLLISLMFHAVPCKIPPWNSMEFHGIRWNIFHGIPWSIFQRTSFPWSSMEFHGKRVPGRVSLKVTQSPSKDKCLETDRLSFSF